MSYKQLIPFNQSTAGKKPGYCEQNVRLGFGAPAKYGSAWANWENTDQHAGDPPAGVDVPAFFWWKDVDNGHVGVHLANGKFWSDGVIYDSIAAFNAAGHTSQYRGWSLHIDGVQVVQVVPDPVPVATGKHINLPVGSGAWHLYKPGGPYNPTNASNYVAVVHPDLYAPGGLTYPIVADKGNGVYEIHSPAHGNADLWTKGSTFHIS